MCFKSPTFQRCRNCRQPQYAGEQLVYCPQGVLDSSKVAGESEPCEQCVKRIEFELRRLVKFELERQKYIKRMKIESMEIQRKIIRREFKWERLERETIERKEVELKEKKLQTLDHVHKIKSQQTAWHEARNKKLQEKRDDDELELVEFVEEDEYDLCN